jgi:hypothetical protein
VLACKQYKNGVRNWRFLGFGGAWLLFFPNAPYIFTDLIHLTARFYGHFWVDLDADSALRVHRAGVGLKITPFSSDNLRG